MRHISQRAPQKRHPSPSPPPPQRLRRGWGYWAGSGVGFVPSHRQRVRCFNLPRGLSSATTAVYSPSATTGMPRFVEARASSGYPCEPPRVTIGMPRFVEARASSGYPFERTPAKQCPWFALSAAVMLFPLALGSHSPIDPPSSRLAGFPASQTCGAGSEGGGHDSSTPLGAPLDSARPLRGWPE